LFHQLPIYPSRPVATTLHFIRTKLITHFVRHVDVKLCRMNFHVLAIIVSKLLCIGLSIACHELHKAFLNIQSMRLPSRFIFVLYIHLYSPFLVPQRVANKKVNNKRPNKQYTDQIIQNRLTKNLTK